MRRFSLSSLSRPLGSRAPVEVGEASEDAVAGPGGSQPPINGRQDHEQIPAGGKGSGGEAFTDESIFGELFHGLPVASVTFDSRGRILDWNSAAEDVYGWTAEEARGKTLWQTLARPEDQERWKKQVLSVFAGQSFRAQEWQHQCADGNYCSVRSNTFPLHDERGGITAAITTSVNLSAHKRAEERLAKHAFHDRLTGLPDRTLFVERIEAVLRRARQSQDFNFAILFLNLDRFKVANESLGHGAADHLLVSTARKIEACISSHDAVARLGGDEFAILLDQVEDENEPVLIAERIQKRLELPITASGQEIYISASIGIVHGRSSYTRAEEVLRDAQAAMDRAKAGGKARYEIFDKGMPSRAKAQLQLEADLRRALGRHELRLDYQPIISLSTGLIDGFEALVRWHHPTRGIVSPGNFIPLAEETGLIIPIGYWALKEACTQLASWQTSRRPRSVPINIAVNLSAKQFMQPNLVEQIKQIVKRTKADPVDLKLEITESAIMDNTEAAIEMVGQLKEMGIKICLDDFGTGYSSLSYLHRFPFNVLKIDQTFVSRMDSDGKDEEIVRAIIALGHSLNMDIVAEGIERSLHLDQLRALKCHYGQGFYFAGGMDARTAHELVMANPQW